MARATAAGSPPDPSNVVRTADETAATIAAAPRGVGRETDAAM
jgi:hypothetical protein